MFVHKELAVGQRHAIEEFVGEIAAVLLELQIHLALGSGKGRVTGSSDHLARCTLRDDPPKYRLRSARERAALSESAGGETRFLGALQNGDFGVAEWASGVDFGRKMGLSENARKGQERVFRRFWGGFSSRIRSW